MSARRDWTEEANNRSGPTAGGGQPWRSTRTGRRRWTSVGGSWMRLAGLRDTAEAATSSWWTRPGTPRVLDVGCVDHSVEAEQNPWFLHRMIADAAARMPWASTRTRKASNISAATGSTCSTPISAHGAR